MRFWRKADQSDALCTFSGPLQMSTSGRSALGTAPTLSASRISCWYSLPRWIRVGKIIIFPHWNVLNTRFLVGPSFCSDISTMSLTGEVWRMLFGERARAKVLIRSLIKWNLPSLLEVGFCGEFLKIRFTRRSGPKKASFLHHKNISTVDQADSLWVRLFLLIWIFYNGNSCNKASKPIREPSKGRNTYETATKQQGEEQKTLSQALKIPADKSFVLIHWVYWCFFLQISIFRDTCTGGEWWSYTSFGLGNWIFLCPPLVLEDENE